MRLLKGAFLLKHHLCKGLQAAACQAGSPDVQPNGSDMDTGVEEERAAAADLAVWPVIYDDVSTNPLSLKLSDPEQGM